jgi:hypothetical protein
MSTNTDAVTREQIEAWAKLAGIEHFTEQGLARLGDFAIFARQERVQAEAVRELREAARQFHNLTQGDPEVIIRPPTFTKRDAIIAAGERLRAALATTPQTDGATVPTLKPRLLNQLRRFNECCEDSEADGHDVDKEDMHSLAEMGAVRPAPGGRHYMTDFGHYLLAATHAPAMAETVRISLLEKALVYVAHSMHSEPQYMLAEGITLGDVSYVRVNVGTLDVSVQIPESVARAIYDTAAQTTARKIAERRDAIAAASGGELES